MKALSKTTLGFHTCSRTDVGIVMNEAELASLWRPCNGPFPGAAGDEIVLYWNGDQMLTL